MKSWVRNYLSITLSVIFVGVAHAGINQWTTTGPAGRSANALVVDPKNPATLYVGTEAGVFKSTDSAESWRKLSLPFAVEVRALTLDPSNPATLYAGYSRTISLPDGERGELGVLKSSDGGVSWTQVSAPSGDDSCGTVLAVAPTTPASVYLGCNENTPNLPRLFKSIDAGRSWTLLGIPKNGGIEKIVVDPATPTIVYTVTFSGTFKSVDSGGTWLNFAGPRLDTPTEIWDLSIAPTVPQTLYANVCVSRPDYSCDPVGTYQSTDGGKSWTVQPRFGAGVIVDPGRPGTLYYRQNLVSQTVDDGRNWRVLNEGFPVGVFFVPGLVMDPRSGSTLYAGVAISDDLPAKGLVYKRQIVGTPPVGVIGTVESPEDGQPVSGIGFLRGWVFSTRPEESSARVVVTGDDRFGTGSEYACCTLRYDVQIAFPQFPPEHTLNSGWGTMMNWGSLSAGSHSLRALFHNTEGDIHHLDPWTVTVIKPGDFEFLDRFSFSGAQASIVDDELAVRGVVVQDFFTKQQKRIDVRYRWFTNQQSLGLVNSETVVALSSGSSQVTTLLAAVARRLWKMPDLIPNAQAAQSIFSNFESPNEGQIASGMGILRGWSFAEVPPDRWLRNRFPSAFPTHLVVDGEVFDRITCCADREDVAAAFPDKAHAILSGWAMQLNSGEFDPGEHTLSVELQSWDGVRQTLTRKITTSRIGGFRFLDQFNLTGATARIEGEEIVLSGVQVRDKDSQQTKVIEVRLRWFQHSQALGIVASS